MLEQTIVDEAKNSETVLIVDEGRTSAGVASEVSRSIAPFVKFDRVVGDDVYIPLGTEACLVLPGDKIVLERAYALLQMPYPTEST